MAKFLASLLLLALLLLAVGRTEKSAAPVLCCNITLPYEQSSGFLGEIIYDLSPAFADKDTEMDADLDYWQSVNPSVCGLVQVEEYNIYYPVIGSVEDNGQWLRTSITGESDVAGSIFLDARSDFKTTPIKMIHGHNMKDGSMFSNIPNYLCLDSCADAPKIKIYTEVGLLYYRVFAVLSVDSTEEAFPIDPYISSKEVSLLIDELLQRSIVPGGTPTSQDILLLNTCWYGLSGNERNLHCIVAASRE